MPSLSKRLFPIRVAIAETLSRVEHYGKLYSLDDLATILNLATNTRDKTISFDHTIITRAFVNDAQTKYALAYKDCFNKSDSSNILYIQLRQRMGKDDRISSIGCLEELFSTSILY